MSDAQEEPGTWRWLVSAGDMIPWVDALRDPNPIHRDPAASEAMGFGPYTINPGPLNLAYACNAIAATSPDGDPECITVRFVGNIRSGDQVVVTADTATNGSRSATVRTDSGTLALDATMTFRSRA